ncbi:alpha/beta hydrolase [Phenylobacterium sp.]|uniref:alpha/beta hydrolase n=1 Tax=Phenylobacterium sp. TaxID=1871053 RepID=UPI00289D9093|nr:alpha/beta hydrolase [Phenylobacterium sp.]
MKRLLWVVGIVCALAAAAGLAFWLSPWPSAFLISRMFAGNDAASEAALAAHVPAGVVERRDLRYGDGADERFDVFFPADTTAPRPTIVWVHGGAWIAGSKEGVSNYLKVLAGQGYTTVAIEYSTGMGSRYPKPVEQVNAALGHLVRQARDLHVDPDQLVLAGDSAGAQIAAQIAVLTTDPSYAARLGVRPALPPNGLKAVMLLSGAFDVGAVDLDGDMGWFLRTVLWAYSGVKDFTKDEQFKLVSVTNYVTPAFPRAFISSGNGDPLEPQAIALADKLEALGGRVERLFYRADHMPALQHEYQFNLDSPEGQLALTRMSAFLDAALAPERTAAGAAEGRGRGSVVRRPVRRRRGAHPSPGR